MRCPGRRISNECSTRIWSHLLILFNKIMFQRNFFVSYEQDVNLSQTCLPIEYTFVLKESDL